MHATQELEGAKLFNQSWDMRPRANSHFTEGILLLEEAP